jgi:hypothetical protein
MPMVDLEANQSPDPSHARRSSVIADLLLIAPHTEIVHHIPGRIRLRLKRSGLDVIAKIDVESLMRGVPGIRSLRINPVVGSLTLEYDQKRLSYSLWEKLGALRNRPELRDQVEALLKDVWG